MTDPLRRHDPLRGPDRHPLTLSALNSATSASHAACIASGGHTPSDVIVTRDGAEMVVCRTCRVPMLAGGKAWAAVYREAARRGAASKHRKDAA